jgi:hypothetical protein
LVLFRESTVAVEDAVRVVADTPPVNVPVVAEIPLVLFSESIDAVLEAVRVVPDRAPVNVPVVAEIPLVLFKESVVIVPVNVPVTDPTSVALLTSVKYPVATFIPRFE